MEGTVSVANFPKEGTAKKFRDAAMLDRTCANDDLTLSEAILYFAQQKFGDAGFESYQDAVNFLEQKGEGQLEAIKAEAQEMLETARILEEGKEVGGVYLKGEKKFKHIDGRLFWDVYKNDPDISLQMLISLTRLEYVRSRSLTANQTAVAPAGNGTNYNSYTSFGIRACFIGSTYLLLENGTPITFSEIARMTHEGKDLPSVASFDESVRQVVFQQPTEFFEHPAHDAQLLYLTITGTEAPLGVTANHQLLITRNGSDDWIEAGSLMSTDALINPYGKSHTFGAPLSEQGTSTLYNLEFSSGETGMHPNYLVSPDGISGWTVAHNKIF